MTIHGRASWTVVDASGLPVGEVEQFLHWLRAIGRSQNTVRSYARHLSLFYRWLGARESTGTPWYSTHRVDFGGAVGRFAPLPTRSGSRAPGTVKAVSAAVREFYEFHRVEGRGPQDLVLTQPTVAAPAPGNTASWPTSSNATPARSPG